MLKPHMVVLLNQNILHGELLSPRPPHDGFRYFYSLFIGQRDGQRRVSPERLGKSPDNSQPVHGRFQTMSRPWDDPALYVTEQCTRGSGGRRHKTKGMGASQGGVIVGRGQSNRKAMRGEMLVFI